MFNGLVEITLVVLETLNSKTPMSTSCWCQWESWTTLSLVISCCNVSVWNKVQNWPTRWKHQQGHRSKPKSLLRLRVIAMNSFHVSSHVHTEIWWLFWACFWEARHGDFINLLFMTLNNPLMNLHRCRVKCVPQIVITIKKSQESAYTPGGKWRKKCIFIICLSKYLCCSVYTWKLVIWHDEGKERLIGATRTNCPACNKVTLQSWTHSCNRTASSHETLLEQSHSRTERRHPDVSVYPAQYTWPQTPFPVTK